MKGFMPILNWIFTAVELLTQLLISPLVLITVVALLLVTKMMGHQVRNSPWRDNASRQSPSAGVRFGT